MLIQSELKAPKNQYNTFGKYKYRSAEDILESVKHICIKYRTALTISDEIVLIGDRYYVKSTASLSCDTGEVLYASAYAREDESIKGMQGSQITGSSSSYARKYALNGLFCIDDTKDPDSTSTHEKTPEKENKKEVKKPDSIDSELKEALTGISKCKDIASLEEVWNTFTGLWTNKIFVDEIKKKKIYFTTKK